MGFRREQDLQAVIVLRSALVEQFRVMRRTWQGREIVAIAIDDAELGISWQKADEISRSVRSSAGPETVVVNLRDRSFEFSPPMAREFASALTAKAREVEEQERAASIALDAAILLRAGVPVGITSDPKIRDEAGKLAAWDSDLRRYMPGGVRSAEMLGRPSILARKVRR